MFAQNLVSFEALVPLALFGAFAAIAWLALDYMTAGKPRAMERLEELADPLVHMVRNSLDHGIEPPEERRAKGKPTAGRIWLRASKSSTSTTPRRTTRSSTIPSSPTTNSRHLSTHGTRATPR